MDKSNCTTAGEIRLATVDNGYLSMLSEYALCNWPSISSKLQKDLQPYWSFRDDIMILSYKYTYLQ